MKRKKLLYALGAFALTLSVLWVWFVQVATIDPPEVSDMAVLQLQRQEPVPGFYTIGNNWMQQNDAGLYELYVEGAPFERGVIYGKLARELVVNQEHYFVAQIRQLVPSPTYQKFLKYLIGWFNRDLDEAIPQENLLEIYGVSRSAADDYEFIGTRYQRLLNYHAAHDIGHALADKHMVVGCTSFGAWNELSADSSLILGRNFDFYVGDDFARDKIVMFVNPDDGQKFMMVTWGGMTGVVSGMNMAGLTVTINAAKSDYPTGAATPISIVARRILQYATTIDEALAIAEKYETFVSESILIGSANDGKAAIIEKTPTKTVLYNTGDNSIVCSNHFQSETFQNDEINQKHKVESSSAARYIRMTDLLDQNYPLDHTDVATILRNYKGPGNTDIGIGNEDAINQLLAHHSVIFQPEKRLVWVSANPVPFNVYIAYDLNKVFGSYAGMQAPQRIDEPELRIEADSFLLNGGYQQFIDYKQQRTYIASLINGQTEGTLTTIEIEQFISLNPEYFEAYELVGDYYSHMGNKQHALQYYKTALAKNIPLAAQKEGIKLKVEELGGAL